MGQKTANCGPVSTKNKTISMTSGFADLGTHKIFYKIRGSGPKLLLISGTNSDTRHSPSIYDVPNADQFEILTFDHRGMGQSSAPESVPETPLSMHSYADDIARLLDHVGWQKTSVVAVSFGGMVAQHFALRHPQKINRLALCCTSSGGAGGSSYPLHDLIDYSAEDYAKFIMKYMNITHDDAWQATNPRRAQKEYEFFLQGAKDSHSTPEKLAAMKAQFTVRASHDCYDALTTLTIPCLVACGADDGVAPPENSRALADIIPAAQLKIFKGGHMFLKEDASAWPALFNFLKDRP